MWWDSPSPPLLLTVTKWSRTRGTLKHLSFYVVAEITARVSQGVVPLAPILQESATERHFGSLEVPRTMVLTLLVALILKTRIITRVIDTTTSRTKLAAEVVRNLLSAAHVITMTVSTTTVARHPILNKSEKSPLYVVNLEVAQGTKKTITKTVVTIRSTPPLL